jgi:hypothetical protein
MQMDCTQAGEIDEPFHTLRTFWGGLAAGTHCNSRFGRTSSGRGNPPGHAAKVPSPAPPPLSSLNVRGREAFKTYLDSGPSKAFAVGGNSHFGGATGCRSTDQAARDTLGFCVAGASAKCRIVNVNNKPIQ